jgi:uncharacterized protein (TIGR02246 family)
MSKPAPEHQAIEADAFAVIERWIAAFNAFDVERTVATYTPEALVLGTFSPGLASSPTELHSYFTAAVATRPRAEMRDHAAIVASDSAVMFSGFYDFTQVRNGETVVVPARFSFLTVKRDGQWLIAHHHSSVRPKPPQ